VEEKLKKFAKLLIDWGKQGGHGSPSGELATLRFELVQAIPRSRRPERSEQ